MPRLPRINVLGEAQHVVQRGKDQHLCFASDEDFTAYANWSCEYSLKYGVEVHAWPSLVLISRIS